MGIYLLILVVPTFIFLLGLTLAIVNFKVKKTSLTIIVGICAAICLGLAIAVLVNNFFGYGQNEYAIIPSYILFYLVFQQQCNQAKTINKYRIFFVLKSVMLLQILDFCISFLANNFITSSLIDNFNEKTVGYFYTLFFSFFCCIFLIAVAYTYLNVIKPLAQFKILFNTAFILLVSIVVISGIISLAISFTRSYGYDYINSAYFIRFFITIIAETLISASIASYIYLKKVDKISEQNTN